MKNSKRDLLQLQSRRQKIAAEIQQLSAKRQEAQERILKDLGSDADLEESVDEYVESITTSFKNVLDNLKNATDSIYSSSENNKAEVLAQVQNALKQLDDNFTNQRDGIKRELNAFIDEKRNSRGDISNQELVNESLLAMSIVESYDQLIGKQIVDGEKLLKSIDEAEIKIKILEEEKSKILGQLTSKQEENRKFTDQVVEQQNTIKRQKEKINTQKIDITSLEEKLYIRNNASLKLNEGRIVTEDTNLAKALDNQKSLNHTLQKENKSLQLKLSLANSLQSQERKFIESEDLDSESEEGNFAVELSDLEEVKPNNELISEKERQITDLESRLPILEEDQSRGEEARESDPRKLQEIQALNDELNKELKALTTDQEKIDDKHNQSVEIIAQLESKNKELNKSVRFLTSNLEAKDHEYTTGKFTFNKIIRDLQDRISSYDSFFQELSKPQVITLLNPKRSKSKLVIEKLKEQLAPIKSKLKTVSQVEASTETERAHSISAQTGIKDNLEKKIVKRDNDIIALKAQIEKLKQGVVDLKQLAHEAENKLYLEQNKKKQLINQKYSFDNELQMAEKPPITELHAQTQSLNNEVNQLKLELSKWKSLVNVGRLSSYEWNENDSPEEIARHIKENINKLESENQQLTTQVQQSQNQLVQLGNQLEEEKQKVSSLSNANELEKANSKTQAEQLKNNSAKHTFDKLGYVLQNRLRVAFKAAQVNTLDQKHNESLKELEKKLIESNNLQELLNTELNNSKAEKNEIQKQLDLSKIEAEEFSAKRERLLMQLEDTSSLENAQQEIEQLKQKLLDNQQELNKAQDKIKVNTDRSKKKNEELKNQGKVLKELKNSNSQQAKELETLRTERSQLQTQIKDTQERLNVLSNTISKKPSKAKKSSTTDMQLLKEIDVKRVALEKLNKKLIEQSHEFNRKVELLETKQAEKLLKIQKKLDQVGKRNHDLQIQQSLNKISYKMSNILRAGFNLWKDSYSNVEVSVQAKNKLTTDNMAPILVGATNSSLVDKSIQIKDSSPELHSAILDLRNQVNRLRGNLSEFGNVLAQDNDRKEIVELLELNNRELIEQFKLQLEAQLQELSTSKPTDTEINIQTKLNDHIKLELEGLRKDLIEIRPKLDKTEEESRAQKEQDSSINQKIAIQLETNKIHNDQLAKELKELKNKLEKKRVKILEKKEKIEYLNKSHEQQKELLQSETQQIKSDLERHKADNVQLLKEIKESKMNHEISKLNHQIAINSIESQLLEVKLVQSQEQPILALKSISLNQDQSQNARQLQLQNNSNNTKLSIDHFLNNDTFIVASPRSKGRDGDYLDPITEEFRKQIIQGRHNHLTDNNVNKRSDIEANHRSELNKIEKKGYSKIHEQFNDKFQDIHWKEKNDSKNSVTGVRKYITRIESESGKTGYDIKSKRYDSIKIYGRKMSNIREIEPLIKASGPLHLSFVAQDKHGNLTNQEAQWSVHYDNHGKISEVTFPHDIKFTESKKGLPSMCYVEREGEVYMLGLSKKSYKSLVLEAQNNKAQYKHLSNIDVVGIESFGQKPEIQRRYSIQENLIRKNSVASNNPTLSAGHVRSKSMRVNHGRDTKT
ncbi:MAG: hypothetical protein AB8B67_03635 [Rickettsiaceae bacterium]